MALATHRATQPRRGRAGAPARRLFGHDAARQIEQRGGWRANRVENGSERRADRVRNGGTWGSQDGGTWQSRREGGWRGQQGQSWREANRDRNWQDRNWRDRNNGNSNDGRWRDSSRRYQDANRWRDNDRRDWNGNGWSDRHRKWDRRWRDDNRYNWYNYRQHNRSHYQMGRYYAPYYGYSYRRLGIGFMLESMFFADQYWIDDPWQYRLPEVYGPYRWVRYYDDVLLVNVYTGEVVDVIYDFFW